MCWKYSCAAVGSGVGIIAAGATLDGLLESGGRPKIFFPFINNTIDKVVGAADPQDPIIISNNYKQKLIKISEANNNAEELSIAIEQINKEDLNAYNVNDAEKGEIKKSILELIKANQEEKINLKKNSINLVEHRASGKNISKFQSI
jgi:hypothetical protein